jgi:hypothetical protein
MAERFTSRGKWRAKLEKEQEREVVEITEMKTPRYPPGRLLIPRPLDVDAVIRETAPGALVTARQIREALAERFDADYTCPLVTGIFVRIAAEAAEEDRAGGAAEVTPWWRVVAEDGSLNPKLPGGGATQAERLAAEGHAILPGRGKKPQRVALGLGR